jgi:hypothetical protein
VPTQRATQANAASVVNAWKIALAFSARRALNATRGNASISAMPAKMGHIPVVLTISCVSAALASRIARAALVQMPGKPAMRMRRVPRMGSASAPLARELRARPAVHLVLAARTLSVVALVLAVLLAQQVAALLAQQVAAPRR